MKCIKHIIAKSIQIFISIVIFFSTICLVSCKNKNFELYSFPFQTQSGIITYYAIQSYTGNDKNVIIPHSYRGNEIRYILDEAFAQSTITSIDIGSIKQIYQYAFANCTFLEQVQLNEVEQISNFAFYSCIRLKSIIIPNTVKVIGLEAFSCCNNLTIYCEAESQPSGWDNNWNSDCTVVWGYNKD